MNNFVNGTQQETIIKWNIDRGLTELNPDLEVKMLTEERREFWLADTMEHKLQEFCDFLFVGVGSEFKMNIRTFNSLPLLNESYEDLDAILYLAHDTSAMYESLKVYAQKQKWNLFNKLEHVIKYAFNIVIRTNNRKPVIKDDSGKIIKGADHIDPITEIKEMLDGLTNTPRSRV